MRSFLLSRSRSILASRVKFLLVFIVTPVTTKLQQYDFTSDRGAFFHPVFRSFICFVNWFCQGLITMAYPAMGYNLISSRREQRSSQWTSELVGIPSLQLAEEAKKYLDHIQDKRAVDQYETCGLEAPRFTVLISFYHHLNYFKKCLDSIQEACSYSPTTSVEILIINDDPSMSSELLMAQATPLLQKKITIHSHTKNLGICASTNEGIAYAQGEWILYLDCDDRLTPDVFSALEKRIQENPHVRYISSRAVDIDGVENILLWRLRSESPRDLIDNNVASHLKVIRKDLHRDLGLLNPIFEGCQDYELALRTAIHEPLCFIPDYLYQYRWHDQSQTVSRSKRQNLTANRIRQTYLLVLYWINHGTKNIQWNITGPSASSWIQHLSGFLARTLHTDLLRNPGRLMDAALDSHLDLGSMYSYSPASKCLPALPHQASRLPRHDQHEISGLDSEVDRHEISGLDSYIVTVEAMRPYQEYRWKCLLIQVATIMIDRYRAHDLERTISVTIPL